MTPLEVLRAHLALRDATGAPVIELGCESEVFTLSASEGRWMVEPGEAERPAFAVSAHWADLMDLIDGYGSVDAALIDGRLEVTGDLLLAMRWIPRLFTAAGSRRGPSSSCPGS
jgi:hypothetical protein